MIVWTLEEGSAAARHVEAVAMAHGFHCALGGSVLHKGESKKDLDIIVYPRKCGSVGEYANDRTPLIDALTAAGFIGWKRCDREDYDDNKIVFRTDYFGKRIDFLFMQ